MSDAEKKSPIQAKGDCSRCKGWIDDGRGGRCIFAVDVWNPSCPYDKAMSGREMEEQVASLERENAKLRKLVQDMWRFTGTACKKYPRLFDPSAQGPQMVQPNAIDSFEQRMQELGIEVG